ncbi:MAG: creatininase family protein, partial [Armatimonadetes bacterium]|nr:creatininase family protein [Armatimonadota bacterium]
GAKVLLLPALPISINENTLGFPWTLSLRPSTIFRCVTDIVSSLSEHGIRQMVLLNGHGGNEFQPHLRELCRQTDVQILLVNWWTCAARAREEIFELPGEHGDEMETSLMLNLHPELVEAERADEGALREPIFTAMREGWAWMARPWHRLTINSGYGDPRLASAEKGERFLEAIVEKLSGLLVEMSEATVDDLYPYHE